MTTAIATVRVVVAPIVPSASAATLTARRPLLSHLPVILARRRLLLKREELGKGGRDDVLRERLFGDEPCASIPKYEGHSRNMKSINVYEKFSRVAHINEEKWFSC